LKAKFFGSKILGGRTPKIRGRNFYAPVGTHHVENFGAIPPIDPDDINQSTPDFLADFRILGIIKLLGADPCLMRYALASVGHPVQTVKFLGGHAPLAPDI